MEAMDNQQSGMINKQEHTLAFLLALRLGRSTKTRTRCPYGWLAIIMFVKERGRADTIT